MFSSLKTERAARRVASSGEHCDVWRPLGLDLADRRLTSRQTTAQNLRAACILRARFHDLRVSLHDLRIPERGDRSPLSIKPAFLRPSRGTAVAWMSRQSGRDCPDDD